MAINKSRRTRRGLLVLAGLSAVAGVSLTGAGAAYGQDQGRGPGDVTFDVVERPLKDVVAYIQERTEVNIVLTKEAEEIPVTLKLRNLPWREALEVVVERVGAQIDERSSNLIRIEKPPRVDFEFDNADARVVIKTIAAAANANIVLGKEVEGTITLKLADVPWRTALDTIVKTLGYAVVQEERGILRIVDPASLRQQLETRVFQLRYARPSPSYKAFIDTQVSKATTTAPSDSPEGQEKEFKLLEAFRQTVAPEGSVTYLASSNALIVTGTTPKLEALERLISRVDVEPAQVFVDVKFIATQNRDFLDIGMGPGEKGLSTSVTFGSMIHDLPFKIGKGGFEDHLSAFRGGPEGFGPLPLTNAAQAFTFGTLDFSSTQFALNLIKQDSSSRIVQAPKLITQDNETATLFVGDTIRYAETTATSNQSGGLEFSIKEATNSPVQVGFQLLMIPHVVPDRDQILMTIIPQQRALSGPDDGFRTYTTGAGGTTGAQQLLLPQERSSTVITNIKLDNGHTAVIGGILQDSESKSQNKIPFLGDVPVLGYLFRTDTTDKSRDNLIIFVTPKIVRDKKHMHDLVLRELNERKDRIDAEMLEIYGSGASIGPSSSPSMTVPGAPSAPTAPSAPAAPAVPKAGLAGPK